MENHRHDVMKVTAFLLLLFCWNVSSVIGCSAIPPMGISERTLRFTVSDFLVPVEMAYTTDNGVMAQVPLMAKGEQLARNFIDRVVKEAIDAIFVEEGRMYFIPHFWIDAILGQITTIITYTPLQCNNVLVNQPPATVLNYDMNKKENCFIRGGFVTALCTEAPSCAIEPPQNSKAAVLLPPQYHSLNGTLRTTNVFMLGWNEAKWRGIFDRVQQFLRYGPYAKNFFRASVTHR